MYTLETTGENKTSYLDENTPDEIVSELKRLPRYAAFAADSFSFVPSMDGEMYVFVKKDLEYNEAAYRRTVLPKHWRGYASGIVKGLLSFHEPGMPSYITVINLSSGLTKKIPKVIVNGSYSFRETVGKIPDYIDIESGKMVFLAGVDLGDDEQYIFDTQRLDFTQEGWFYEHLPPELQDRAIAIVRWETHSSKNDMDYLRRDDESLDQKNEDHDESLDYVSDALDIQLHTLRGELIDLSLADRPRTRQ